MNNKVPIKRFIRENRIAIVRYVFGDTSGTVFGSSWLAGSDKIKYRYGVWGSDNEDDSSNFKEFNSLVETPLHHNHSKPIIWFQEDGVIG